VSLSQWWPDQVIAIDETKIRLGMSAGKRKAKDHRPLQLRQILLLAHRDRSHFWWPIVAFGA
jgi:hypothetical protein